MSGGGRFNNQSTTPTISLDGGIPLEGGRDEEGWPKVVASRDTDPPSLGGRQRLAFDAVSLIRRGKEAKDVAGKCPPQV